MYSMGRLKNGAWLCVVRIQDGEERWEEPDTKSAIQSIIKAARVLNGDYITHKDIRDLDIGKEPPESIDSVLLDEIKRGVKVILDHQDLRVKYGIMDDECELILKIREGDAQVTYLSRLAQGDFRRKVTNTET